MAEQSTTSSKEKRPSPKALLELAARENRGKLKVFLGMAPGVGKTYAMLSAARAQKAEGVDVLVGVVETHGRSETAGLLDGLEVLPRKPVPYRRRTLMEFDVEAAIARRPKLLLVDEFAHTNAPSLIHPKRYQDVEEILRNGIDVWTTLNIQHLESLQDVVQKITGVRVQETVPDKAIEKADEIVVVDLPPEELIQRLKEGKVYLPDNARRAIDQFFRPSNLTALRELALRRTADRVDEQMLAQLRQQGIEGPWPTAERILVCVGSDAHSEAVIRVASRLARAQKSEWIALHLSPSDREIADRAVVRRTEKMMRLAERLGASTARLNATDLAGNILSYAKRNNITQIIIGRSKAGRIGRLLGRSLSRDLVRRADGLSVLIVAPEADKPSKGHLPATPQRDWTSSATLATSIAVATGAVTASVLAGLALEQVTRLPNLSMVFLLAVLLCGMRFGTLSAIAASVLSFFAYNFFFIGPRHTFTIAEPHELLSLFIFLAVAFVTGSLAGRLREQATATRERAEAMQALFDFSRKLSGAPKLDDVLWLLASQVAAIAKGKSVVLLDQGKGLSIESGWPPEDELATSDWAAARWANEKQEPAGRGTETLPSARFHFRPILGSKGSIGAVGIDPGDADDAMSDSVASTLQSFIEQAAVAIERIALVEQASKAETAAEGERLRAALLSSISHDLRTPLASIVGSVTSLRTLGDRMPRSDRSDLLATIEEEAGRLSRFVSNLLDMTRLEAGAIDIRRDWVDVRDAVASAIDRARKAFPGRKIESTMPDTLPLIRGDAALLEQVMLNLLDNAHKYSDLNSATEVKVTSGPAEIMLTVSDRGIGIPAEALEKVFDKFYRVAGSDGRAPGTGLGLSICAGIVKGMGGAIKAESPIVDKRGTRITVTLPIEANGLSRQTGGLS
ncbi:MAG: sensor histidine kinase KdpD [Hyphomicrobium sp.]|jgi:two-component system sensor histidine kinase KdpD|nr:sensor histidine kinase KdpD [Hyphomicrobium sp.]